MAVFTSSNYMISNSDSVICLLHVRPIFIHIAMKN